MRTEFNAYLFFFSFFCVLCALSLSGASLDEILSKGQEWMDDEKKEVCGIQYGRAESHDSLLPPRKGLEVAWGPLLSFPFHLAATESLRLKMTCN